MPKRQVIAIVDDDELARGGTIDLVKSIGFIAKAIERSEDLLKSDYLHSSSSDYFPAHDRDRARARQAGAICYLAKPFGDEDLLACVRSALEPREAE